MVSRASAAAPLGSPSQVARVILRVLCHLRLGGGQAEGVGGSRMWGTGIAELLERGREVGGPGRRWSCSAWRDHVLSMGCWRGGQRAQGAVNEVGFERGLCRLSPGGVGGKCWCPRAVVPHGGSALPCHQGCVLLPGAHVWLLLVAQLPCVGLVSGGEWGTFVLGALGLFSNYWYCWIFFQAVL